MRNTLPYNTADLIEWLLDQEVPVLDMVRKIPDSNRNTLLEHLRTVAGRSLVVVEMEGGDIAMRDLLRKASLVPVGKGSHKAKTTLKGRKVPLE